jgi:hypothetical protein
MIGYLLFIGSPKSNLVPLSRDQDRPIEDALAAVQEAAGRVFSKDEFDLAREEIATRMGEFRAQQQRFQRLNEYCKESVATISASLGSPRSEGC